jgi:hypothetical protein
MEEEKLEKKFIFHRTTKLKSVEITLRMGKYYAIVIVLVFAAMVKDANSNISLQKPKNSLYSHTKT